MGPPYERALYTHSDGRVEEVEVRSHHPEVSAYSIFVPSLNRERQTTETRLKLQSSLPSSQSSPAKRGENMEGVPTLKPKQLSSSYSQPPQTSNSIANNSIISGTANDWPVAMSAVEARKSYQEIKSDLHSQPSTYSYHKSLPDSSYQSSNHVVQTKTAQPTSPWAPAAWTSSGGSIHSGAAVSGGTSRNGYAEIVDGVFGVGVASCPPSAPKQQVGEGDSKSLKSTSEKGTIYSRMLQATNSVQGQKVQEMSAFQDSYNNFEGGQLVSRKHVVEYSSSQWGSISAPKVEISASSDGTYRPSSASTSLFASVGDKLRSYGSMGAEIGYRSLHAVPEDKTQEQAELEDVEPVYDRPRDPVDIICEPCCTVS